MCDTGIHIIGQLIDGDIQSGWRGGGVGGGGRPLRKIFWRSRQAALSLVSLRWLSIPLCVNVTRRVISLSTSIIRKSSVYLRHSLGPSVVTRNLKLYFEHVSAAFV